MMTIILIGQLLYHDKPWFEIMLWTVVQELDLIHPGSVDQNGTELKVSDLSVKNSIVLTRVHLSESSFIQMLQTY